jgi:hypothetical protein
MSRDVERRGRDIFLGAGFIISGGAEEDIRELPFPTTKHD